jgi:hypothetical protein
MRLSVAGRQLTTECDWQLCTALRDNVQHYLEGGLPSGRFPAVHTLADRCWATAAVTVPAAQLRTELEEAWPVLNVMTIDRMAISIRSRAALTGNMKAPTARGTVLLRLTGWKLPLKLAGAQTLGDVFGDLVLPMIGYCQKIGDRAQIEVGPVREDKLPPRRRLRQPKAAS